jgi:hypothetical protein
MYPSPVKSSSRNDLNMGLLLHRGKDRLPSGFLENGLLVRVVGEKVWMWLWSRSFVLSLLCSSTFQVLRGTTREPGTCKAGSDSVLLCSVRLFLTRRKPVTSPAHDNAAKSFFCGGGSKGYFFRGSLKPSSRSLHTLHCVTSEGVGGPVCIPDR